MGYSHLTDEEIMELLNDISNDIPHKEISKKYNVTIFDISNISKINGIIDVRRKERLKQNNRIIELYQEGYNYAEIGRAVGCSGTGVRKILDKFGIPKRDEKQRNENIVKRNEEIIRLYQTGNYTRHELGEKFNLSHSYIGQIINESLHISNDKSLDMKFTKINNMISNGKTNEEIGKEMNISKRLVASIYYNNQNYQNKIKERNDKIFALYQTGNYTQRKLCKMFNLSRGYMSKIISNYKK